MLSKKTAEGKAGPSEVYILEPSTMETGDIILTASGTWVDFVIRLSTGGKYSHAAIYTQVGLLMEATVASDWTGGVRRSSSMRFVADDLASLCVLRLRHDLPNRKVIADKAAARAEWKLDHTYWMDGVISFLRSKHLAGQISQNDTQSFFCSHLVAAAYNEAGLDLLPGIKPELTAPSDFLKSGYLENVTAIVSGPEDEAIARLHAPKDDDSPHAQIELAVNQRILSNQAVRSIVARYNLPSPGGYWDLLTILAKTGNPDLDKIMAAGVDEVAQGLRRSWKIYGIDEDRIQNSEEILSSGLLTQTQIKAELRFLKREREILEEDIKTREKDVEENTIVAQKASDLETFTKRMVFSKVYLNFMRDQLTLLNREIFIFSRYALSTEPE
jgi:hypothetical protein